MSDLARLFRDAAASQQLSNREIAKKSGLSSPTVDRMMNGTGQPKPENVDLVAHALGVPLTEARRAAGQPRGEAAPYAPPPEANLLNDRQRRAVDELIRSIVATQGASHGLETAPQQDASSEADQDQKTVTAIGRRRPQVRTTREPVDDDTPPPVELADAARDEPGHVKTGDRVRHLDDQDPGEVDE